VNPAPGASGRPRSGRREILLFNPAPRRGFQAHRRVELPLSLLCVGSPLDRLGYRVRIVDQFASPTWEREFEEALESEPLCVGITSMTGPQILRALEATHAVKRRYPHVPVVWGGIHASLLPEQTLQEPGIDAVVVGEGEATFAELVQTIEAGGPLESVQGIVYKRDGQVHATPSRPFVDIDREPPLSYHLVDVDLYRRNLFGVDHLSFNSSRGCTFRCSFCWDPVMHKRTWRAMQPRTVVDQLRRIVEEHGVRGFLFTDDHFFIDLRRARGILQGIVEAGLGLTISKVQIRADTICAMDDEFLDLLVRANVRRMTVGVESGSQRVLDLIQKDVSVEQVIEANRRIAALPIVPLYLFMMGMPTETPEEFRQSIRLADRLVADNPKAAKTFNIYTPYPGTELYELALQQGLRCPERLPDWARFNFRNVQKDAPWIVPETRRLVERLDFPLMFLGTNFTSPYRKTNPAVVALARLYAPIARYRVNNLDGRLPFETRITKMLGLFARQG
jgi:radical SAM superfamily enzyme YgiQ (UPF0313 family)